MIALKLFFATYGKWFKFGAWALLVVMVLSAWLYVSHLQNTRDSALKEVAGLQKTLDDERTAAKALADAKVETAKAASTVAATQVVQKKREIEQSSQDLKREISNVYQAKSGATSGVRASQEKESGSYGSESIALGYSASGLESIRDDGGIRFGVTCFGGDFKRLWNAANTSAGGVSSPTAP